MTPSLLVIQNVDVLTARRVLHDCISSYPYVRLVTLFHNAFAMPITCISILLIFSLLTMICASLMI